MPMQTPSFWYKRSRSLCAYLLMPIAWIYQIIHKLNTALKPAPYKSSIPVICVGNAVAGGSGKTPTVIALVSLLKKENICKNPYIISRGYGGQIKKTTLVNTSKQSAHDVGDEPLLLSKHAPVIIGANRAESAKLAEENGADCIVMDDGLFHQSLFKTLTLLVVDRSVDFGNSLTIPAGPLREPLKNVLPRVQGIICIGQPFHSDIPVIQASIEPSNTIDTQQKYIAFAGLGRPEKFKKTLEENNINLVGWHPFPDHHPYSNNDIEKLQHEAADNDAKLITTEKDFTRLNKDLSRNIKTLNIELNIQNTPLLTSTIKSYIK